MGLEQIKILYGGKIMLTARKGAMLSNGVFLQDGDFVKITYVDGNIIT